MNYWRFIPLLEAAGEVQMAIDGWLLENHRQGKHPPTLRFYTWSPAAISLGYHQHHYPSHWHQLIWAGKPLSLVRRPTGGRAVLHQGDLTYMIVTSEIKGKRIEVYQKLCQFLIDGWRSLGINLYYGNSGRGYIHNPNCFGTATNADLITSDGCKLIGSAQVYQGKAILQHGSMLLNPDQQLFEQVFENWTPQKFNLPLDVIINALTQAACECFNIELLNQPLSESEWLEIKLIHNKGK